MTSTHEPPGYECPFCRLVEGGATELTDQRDVVCRARGATAIMSPHWWPHNRGHVIVVPNRHHENIYTLPPDDGHNVQDLVRDMATAMRSTYGCQGVTIRQNNEPAGNQDVWHFHVHVLPRFPGDGLYRSNTRQDLSTAATRKPYADRLRAYFDGRGPNQAWTT